MRKIKGFIAVVLMGSVLIACIASFHGCAGGDKRELKPFYRVGIIQPAPFSELNEARKGIVESIRQSDLAGKSRIDVEWATAGENRLTIPPILEQFEKLNFDLIITISSPCLEQAVKRVYNTPVVFGVTIDPAIIGLKIDGGKDSRMFSGIYGDPPLLELGRRIRQIMPEANTLGVLWNPSEINSRYEMLALRKMSTKYNFEILEARVRNSKDMEAKAIELVSLNPDVILLIADNTVARSFSFISPIFERSGIPVFSDFTGLVEDIAVLMIGLDHYGWGRATGEMAEKVLAGTPIHQIPLERFEDIEVVVNTKKARTIGITIPSDVLSAANRVIK